MSDSNAGTTTAASTAVSEVGRIARALHALPGQCGTADQLAAATRLPRRVVVRRLMGSGTARPPSKASARVFTVVRRRSFASAGLYGLTAFGLSLAGGA